MNRTNPNKFAQSHSSVKLLKAKDKEYFLKAEKDKWQFTHSGKNNSHIRNHEDDKDMAQYFSSG